MALADDILIKQSAQSYEKDIVPFQDIIKQLQTPVDTVAESEAAAIEANARAQAQTARLQERYGIQMTPAERQQQSKLAQITGQSNVAGSMNFARRRDEEANLQRLSTLADIFSSERQTAFGALGSLAGLSTARKNAYESARAASASQHYGFLGGMGAKVGALLGSLV